MLISHSRPRNIAWALRNAAGALLPFVTSPARLTNGRPGSVTRFVWPTGAYAQIEATWSEPSAIGLFGLIGTSLPAGMIVNLAFRIAGTSDFVVSPAMTQLIRRPMGERVSWVRVAPSLEGFDGMRLRLSNSFDVGFPFVFPGTHVDIGEIWLGQAEEIEADANWSMEYEDPTIGTETDLMQPYSQRGTVRRILTFTPSVREETLHGTPDNFPLIEGLLAKTNRGQQSVAAPRYAGADAYMLPITATFGTLTGKGSWKHVDGPHYEHASLTMREAGIPVALNE